MLWTSRSAYRCLEIQPSSAIQLSPTNPHNFLQVIHTRNHHGYTTPVPFHNTPTLHKVTVAAHLLQ